MDTTVNTYTTIMPAVDTAVTAVILPFIGKTVALTTQGA